MPTSSYGRPDLDDYFLKMLELVASRSTCIRRRVGCIVTDDHGIILATGYNGVPSGLVHCTDEPCPGAEDLPGNTSRCWAVHAEINALIQCHRLDLAKVMYVSNSPCFMCAKAICNTSIRKILYLEDYSDFNGRYILSIKGIQLIGPEAR